MSGQSDVKEEIVHTLYLTFVTSQSRNLYCCIAMGADTPDICYLGPLHNLVDYLQVWDAMAENRQPACASPLWGKGQQHAL